MPALLLLQVWSPKEQRPVAAVDTGANVCSVRFNPWNEHMVAVGSAAHTAMVYDLRMLRSELGDHSFHCVCCQRVGRKCYPPPLLCMPRL
jgi:hypothetical protein